MFRNSLRRRIFRAFLGLGIIVGPLVAIAILFVSVELQEWRAERALLRDMQAVVAGSGEPGLRFARDTDGISVRTNVDPALVPIVLLELPDGLHEHESGQRAWLISARTTPEGRVVLFRNIAPIERRERQSVVYAAAGGLLALLGGWFAASRVARRLAGPLESLTDGIASMDTADDARSRLAAGLPDDEIGLLGEALDEYRDRVRRALQRERHFSADISHELRNPLAVIRSATEVIDADPELPARSRPALRRLDLAAARMQETVSTLLELLREPGEHDTWPATDVAERARAVLEHERGGAGKVRVREQLLAGVTVNAPPAVVDAVIGNLVRNAYQHSGCAHLHVRMDTRCLCVEDDGIGMPSACGGPARPESVETVRGTGPGSGLGLSLVRRLCERFGWQLEIASFAQQGTRATWWFNRAGETPTARD